MDEEGRLLPEGLGPFADQIIEAMGTRAEREARAPYSPPDWPYEPGELVKSEQHTGVWLHETFGMWTMSAEAPFWVGKRVFGARWRGADKPGDMWLYQEYLGHFPVRTVDPLWFRRLPDHLADVNPVELQAVLFDSVHVWEPDGWWRTQREGMDTLPLHWTQERWIDGYTGPRR